MPAERRPVGLNGSPGQGIPWEGSLFVPWARPLCGPIIFSPAVSISWSIVAGSRTTVKDAGQSLEWVGGNKQSCHFAKRDQGAAMPEPFCTIEEAMSELRAGRMIVLVDDEN